MLQGDADIRHGRRSGTCASVSILFKRDWRSKKTQAVILKASRPLRFVLVSSHAGQH
jgi:hypothetical protein